MKKVRLSLLLLIFSIVMSSCSHRMLDFTLISSKNVDLSKGASFMRGKGRVHGKDKIHLILFIPTGSVDIKEALDLAIETTPGCVALLDGVIYTKFWWIPFIYGQQSVLVEGLPLIDPAFAENAGEPMLYGKVELDKNGEVKKVEKLSVEEYDVLKDKIAKDSHETPFTVKEKH
ncbi:MAG: hypothetical protein LBT50_04975 [Prevotellaceae bacterium]|jgi:hypothetical protein|nr:hypothetical protein [Prevotellaceae bacterium]